MLFEFSFRASLALIALALPAAAQDGHQHASGADKPAAAANGAAPAANEALIAAQKPTYPMNSCVACGKIWGEQDAPLDIVFQGRLVRLCNAECVKAFGAQAAKWFKVLDDQIIAAQAATYPLTHCPVTDEELDKKPKYVVIGTRLVETCCGDCKKELLGDGVKAAAALAKVDAALIAAQGQSYPLAACVVDDQPLGDAPVQTLHGVTLVRFCSEACEAKFKAGPKEFLAKLEAARRSGATAAPKSDEPESGEAKPGR